MMEYYSRKKYTFGKYQGIELGVVFLFDPSYVGWCISKFPGFYVRDLDILENNGVLYRSGWLAGSTKKELSQYPNYPSYVKNMNLDRSYRIPQEVRDRNEENRVNKGRIKVRIVKKQ